MNETNLSEYSTSGSQASGMYFVMLGIVLFVSAMAVLWRLCKRPIRESNFYAINELSQSRFEGHDADRA